MTEIIGVRFKSGGKQYYFDPNGQAVAPGQGVIIETSRGLEYGECTQGNTMVEDEARKPVAWQPGLATRRACPMMRSGSLYSSGKP